MNAEPSAKSVVRELVQSDEPTESRVTLRGLTLWISAGGILLWLLFELQRAPYRPPVDLSTFLGGSELAGVRTLMIVLSVPEVLLISWFLVRVSLVGCRPKTSVAKFLRCAPTLVAGLLLTFAIGHVLSDYVTLQMKLEAARSNIWDPLPKGTTGSAE